MWYEYGYEALHGKKNYISCIISVDTIFVYFVSYFRELMRELASLYSSRNVKRAPGPPRFVPFGFLCLSIEKGVKF
jgi:hypothetical protein